MTTSVPTVIPLEHVKWRIAALMERASEVYQATGDINALDKITQLARELYESELKPAAHKGLMDWGYLNKYALALEKVENFIRKVKEHHEAGRG